MRRLRAGRLALLLALLVGGCARGDSRVDALRRDPMATIEVEGAAAERVTTSEGDTGAIPSPAKVRRTFSVRPGTTDRLVDELARLARDSGWDLEAREVAGFNGYRRVDGYDVRLIIGAVDTEGAVWVELSTRDS